MLRARPKINAITTLLILEGNCIRTRYCRDHHLIVSGWLDCDRTAIICDGDNRFGVHRVAEPSFPEPRSAMKGRETPPPARPRVPNDFVDRS